MELLQSFKFHPREAEIRRRLGLLAVLLGTGGYSYLLSAYVESFGRNAALVAPVCLIYGFVYLWKVKQSASRPGLAQVTGLLLLNLLALLNAQMLASYYLPLLESDLLSVGTSRSVLFLIFYGFGLQLAKFQRLLLAWLFAFLPWSVKKHYFLFVDSLRVYHQAVHQAGHHFYARRLCESSGCGGPVSRFYYRSKHEGETLFPDSAAKSGAFGHYLLAGGLAETIFFGFQLGEDPLHQGSDYRQLRQSWWGPDRIALEDYSTQIGEIITELQQHRPLLQQWATALVERGVIEN